MKIILRIFHEVTGCMVELQKANRIVNGKIDCLEKKDPVSNYGDDRRSQLSENVLMRHLEEELARRIVIEDKAKTNVLGITLAFSAMFAGIALISSSSAVSEFSVHWPLWVFIASLFIGVLFLLLGGALALSALRIAKIYTWTLDDEVINTTDDIRAVRLLWYVELNQRATLLKTNQVDASYSCIRNGVISLAIAAIFIACSGALDMALTFGLCPSKMESM